MNDNAQDEPKIIIDDDWKAQAQAEKAKLAAEQEAGGSTEAGGHPDLPPATFSTLITTMASQALFALGAAPDPQTQKRYLDLDLAKFHIDTLKVIDEKTAGNLTDDEKTMLDTTLYELRTQFMQVSQSMGA